MLQKPYLDASVSPREYSYIFASGHRNSHRDNHAEHFLEKPRAAVSFFARLRNPLVRGICLNR